MNFNCPNCNAPLSLTLATNPTPPTPTPKPIPTPPTATSYPISRLTDDDKRWLVRMAAAYSVALRTIPGAHQLLPDILTDGRGNTVWDLGGPQGGGAGMQTAINRIINSASAGGDLYDSSYNPATYTGPLKAVYANLVASKKP